MVVRDEAVLRAIDTFATEQGAGGEAMKDLENDILMRLASVFMLLGAFSILKNLRSSVCSRMRASFVMRSLNWKII
jgi:hypothetical protein